MREDNARRAVWVFGVALIGATIGTTLLLDSPFLGLFLVAAMGVLLALATGR